MTDTTENQIPVPTTLEGAISPEWLSDALSIRFPGTRVESVTPSASVHGVGTKVLIGVTYRSNDAALPTRFCVKAGYEPHNKHILETGLYVREARFYRDLADEIGVAVPRAYAAATDDVTLQGVLVLEDLTARNVTFGSAEAGLPAETAAAVLSELAKFHAWAWDGTRGASLDWIPVLVDGLAGPGMFTAETLQELLDGERGASLPAAVRDGRRLRDAFLAFAAWNRQNPHCFLHGDPHVRNLYVDAHGAPGLYDWQTIQRGTWSIDVAYFLAAALSDDDRDRSLHDLLEHYRSELSHRGVEPPTSEVVWDHYRRSLPYGFYLWTMTRPIVQPIEAITAFVCRIGRAAAEAKAFQAHDI